MLALKCDNCGRYFEFGDKDDTNRISYSHENTDGRVVYSANKHYCPVCMAAIMKALEHEKAWFQSKIPIPWPMEDDLK